MAVEAKLLSKLVKTQLPEHNKNILYNIAAITDVTDCNNCAILCPIIVLVIAVGCWAVCIFSVGAACPFCYSYMQALIEVGGLCASLCYLICYVWNQVNVPAYWLSSITDYSWYGTSAGVWDPNNLVGPSIDDQYACIYAGNYGDQAVIVGEMNDVTHGHIYLYGYSAAGYYSHLYVYVSYNYQNWYQVSSQTVNPGSAHSIDCGTYANNFRYIAIVVYDDQGWSGKVYVDAVSVVP